MPQQRLGFGDTDHAYIVADGYDRLGRPGDTVFAAQAANPVAGERQPGRSHHALPCEQTRDRRVVVVGCQPPNALQRVGLGTDRAIDGALKQLTKLRSIHERPASVQTRRQAGHWEGDLIVGAQQRSAVATLVERKMRLTLLIRLPNGHSAQHVGDALIATFTQMPVKLRRTLTWDQGNEMFHHKRIEAATGLKIYFADPHSPWQRGSNENANGLVRQYLPKGTDLSIWDDGQLRQIADELNDRPRLCLKDNTPTELLRRWERQYTLH